VRPEEGAGVADWADASAAGIPALPTAAGVTAESTAVALADEFVESSAAKKNGGTSNATAAMVAIIRVLNFIVVLLNCCSRKSSILTIKLARFACDWLECGNSFPLPSLSSLARPACALLPALPLYACAETVLGDGLRVSLRSRYIDDGVREGDRTNRRQQSAVDGGEYGDSVSPGRDARGSDNGSVERPAGRQERRGAANVPEDVRGLSAIDQNDTLRY